MPEDKTFIVHSSVLKVLTDTFLNKVNLRDSAKTCDIQSHKIQPPRVPHSAVTPPASSRSHLLICPSVTCP